MDVTIHPSTLYNECSYSAILWFKVKQTVLIKGLLVARHSTAFFYCSGTGCNVAYLETLENVDKWEGPHTDPKQVTYY